MAASLSVSRGPVRDAIVLLRQEGLLQGDWHKGSRVTVFTNSDLEEIYSLRHAIEVLAVKRLTANRSERDLEIIKTRTEAIDRAVEIGDPQQMLQADIAFHDAIYACARHERLEQVWLGLRSQIALLLLNRQRANDEYRGLISAEHWEMYRVIKNRDTARAERLVQDHIESAFESGSFPDSPRPLGAGKSCHRAP